MYDSFHHYSSGVYSQTANEKRTAGAEFTGHAMTLIGWGEEGGVPYWLIQNSWGDHRGEKGLVKFCRGYDDFEMESQGIWFVKPEIPTVCANAECKNGATILKDCTCKCTGGFTGSSCETCNLQCKNGGVRKDDCSGCYCPVGFAGLDCGDGFTVETRSVCEMSGREIVAPQLQPSLGAARIGAAPRAQRPRDVITIDDDIGPSHSPFIGPSAVKLDAVKLVCPLELIESVCPQEPIAYQPLHLAIKGDVVLVSFEQEADHPAPVLNTATATTHNTMGCDSTVHVKSTTRTFAPLVEPIKRTCVQHVSRMHV